MIKKKVVNAWKEVFNKSQISLDQSFSSLGGHSKEADLLYQKLVKVFGEQTAISPTIAYDYPTVAKQITYIQHLLQGVEEIKKNIRTKKQEPIAIVGMSCRFPANANSLEDFWQLLVTGKDALEEIPSSRWDVEQYYSPDRKQSGKMVCRKGGFISDHDKFDAEFFHISPREAEFMDPNQRVALETAWHALEEAGIDLVDLEGSLTGVFFGVMFHDYDVLLERANLKEESLAYLNLGTSQGAVAGRIAYELGLQGPAMVIDTACSSSLVALHEACQSLRDKDCHLAIAGGVNLMLLPEVSIGFSQANMLSPDGVCKSFSDDANGYVRGEGCAVVVLKRLKDAIKEKDQILAVIKSSCVNQDGASGGMTQPSRTAQQQLLLQALKSARLSPNDIDYIEAHGTGTPLGDPIEIGAIREVFKHRETPLLIGSVKSNIGHLEAAAGMAGLFKVVLALQHQIIPANLHFCKLNPRIHLEDIPASIVTENKLWPKSERPRRAGISSFGFTGTNAHVIVEEAAALNNNSTKKPLPKTQFRRTRYWATVLDEAQKKTSILPEDWFYEKTRIELPLSKGIPNPQEDMRIIIDKSLALQLPRVDMVCDTSQVVELFLECQKFIRNNPNMKRCVIIGKCGAHDIYEHVLLNLSQIFNWEYEFEAIYIGVTAQADIYAILDEIEYGHEPVVYLSETRKVERIQRANFSWQNLKGIEADNDGYYLITGGLGGLGFALLQELLRKGIKNIILCSRHAPSDVQQKEILRLQEEFKAIITHKIVDVSDKTALEELIQHFKLLRGIFHLAGTETNAGFEDHTEQQISDVLKPKLAAWNLHLLTQNLPLKYFVLFSSSASFLGSNRQGAYVIANGFLDALADMRQYAGLPITHIHWGPWQERGMALIDEQMAKWSADFIPLISGLNLLMQVLSLPACIGLGVMSPRYAAFRLMFDRHASRDWQQLFGFTQQKKKKQGEFLAIYYAIELTRRREYLLNFIEEKLKVILHLADEQKVATEQGFFKMGMDSLMAVELHTQLQEAVGDKVELRPMMVFDYPTLSRLTEYLYQALEGVSSTLAVTHAHYTYEPIAVIGLEVKFPGGANNKELFWNNLLAAKDAIRLVEPFRWDNERYPFYAGFIDDIALFDADFFNISAREAEQLDPQQRILLETCWHALQDAGIVPVCLQGSETGVFVGISQSDYGQLLAKSTERDFYQATGTALNVAAGRLSYALGLQGPAMVIDTACSSSLVALHEACRSLVNNECDLAIAAGTHVLLDPKFFQTLMCGNMLSPDNICKTFDKDANGYVRGEGCGVLVLKRLSDAQRDQDRIYALIKGSAVNQDGASSGLTVPNGIAQEKVLAKALANANVEAKTIDYVETHGTGTSLGDPIEVSAIRSIYGQNRDTILTIGSVKTNIGHLEAASGIAGAIKTILALYHECIPQHLHFKEINPSIHLDDIPARIPLEPIEWKRRQRVRRAGVSSFGFSGTNAHIILEEAPVQDLSAIKQSLPKTEFHRQHYWVQNIEPAISLSTLPTSHPFLQHQVFIPGRHGLYFESMISKHYPEFIPDHKIYGYTVVAGACYISLAFSLARDYLGMTWCQISDVEFIEALVVDKVTRLWVSYEAPVLEVFSQAEDQAEATLRVRMKIEAGKGLVTDSSLAEIRHELENASMYSGKTHLLRAERLSLQLGPHFHWLEEVYFNEDQWLGRLRSASGIDETKRYVIYPGLLDSFFQSGVTQSESVETLTIPLAIASITMDVRCAMPRWISARLSAQNDANSQNWHANFILWNEAGEVIGEIKDFTAQRATQAALERSLQRQHAVENIYYAPIWNEVEMPIGSENDQVIYYDARLPTCDAATSEQTAIKLLAVLQTWIVSEEITSVVIITEHAYAVVGGDNIVLSQAVLNGLIKTAQKEYPRLMIKQVDIEPDVNINILQKIEWPSDISIAAIRKGKWYTQSIETYEQVCISKGLLHVPPERDWKLQQIQRGRLESLRLTACEPTTLGAYDVELAVQAVGLNFRDVLVALDLYPGEGGDIGADCAGVITRIGEQITHLSVGDRVYGLAWGAFSHTVRTDARLLGKLPSNFSYEQGASIITPLLTAYYGLHYLAQVKEGEKVLIHTGAGAVGLWAIQLMLQRGACVFATTSIPKQDYLRSLGVKHVYNSRDTNYSQAILAATDGKGVDVVLNTLTSNGFKEATLNCLAVHGRWIEISKRDIYTESELYKLRSDVIYHTVAIDTVYTKQPDLIHDMLQELEPLLGQILNPIPTTLYPLMQLRGAMKYLQQGENIGKVVITLPATDLQLQANASYVITGGMGGIGLEAAKYLKSCGAGRIIVAGRHAKSVPPGIETYICDVSNKLDVEKLIKYCHHKKYPLKGIFHAAGIIQDATLDKQTEISFQQVFSAKAQGAWYLHETSKSIDLDYFVMFSSIASLMGFAGQANYASANSFLDGLAEYRRAHGLKALSINWGPWREVGMAKELVAIHERQGLKPFKTEDALAALNYALTQDQTQLGIVHWDKKQSITQVTDSSFLERFYMETAEQQPALLKQAIIKEINKVLGKTGVVDENKGFFDMGMDSLMALELKNRLQNLTQQTLSNTLIFDYPTVNSLTEYLLHRILGESVKSKETQLYESRVNNFLSMDVDEIQKFLRGEKND